MLLEMELYSNTRELHPSTTGRPIGVAEVFMRIIEDIITKRHLASAANKLHKDNFTLQRMDCQKLGVIAQLRLNHGDTDLSLGNKNAFGMCDSVKASDNLTAVDVPHLAYLLRFVCRREYISSARMAPRSTSSPTV
jgi:hypothetical protein